MCNQSIRWFSYESPESVPPGQVNTPPIIPIYLCYRGSHFKCFVDISLQTITSQLIFRGRCDGVGCCSASSIPVEYLQQVEEMIREFEETWLPSWKWDGKVTDDHIRP